MYVIQCGDMFLRVKSALDYEYYEYTVTISKKPQIFRTMKAAEKKYNGAVESLTAQRNQAHQAVFQSMRSLDNLKNKLDVLLKQIAENEDRPYRTVVKLMNSLTRKANRIKNDIELTEQWLNDEQQKMRRCDQILESISSASIQKLNVG